MTMSPRAEMRPFAARDAFAVSAWFGLVTGIGEVLMLAGIKLLTGRFVFVSQDTLWMAPLAYSAIALLVPAQAGLVVAEYAPNQVKKSVVGVGHAGKEQVHAMVKILLPLSTAESPDASDALAVAITHAHLAGANSRMAELLARAR